MRPRPVGRFVLVVEDHADGFELCAKLREQEHLAGTPLVVLGGQSPDAFETLTCDAYLATPLVPDRLLETLQRLFAPRD